MGFMRELYIVELQVRIKKKTDLGPQEVFEQANGNRLLKHVQRLGAAGFVPNRLLASTSICAKVGCQSPTSAPARNDPLRFSCFLP
jgi:hypothetical protein